MLISVALIVELYIAFIDSIGDAWTSASLAAKSLDQVLLVTLLILSGTVLNWSLEALKWKKSTTLIKHLSFKQAIIQVAKGVAFTMITPNRIGEFYGRVEGWSRKAAIQGAIINSYNGFFQSIVTVLVGILALMFAPESWKLGIEEYLAICSQFIQAHSLWFVIGFIALITTLFPFLKPLSRFIRELKVSFPRDLSLSTKSALLCLSLGRYIVFSSQFVLLLWFIGVHLPLIDLFTGVAIGYFVLFALPSIALAELGIREMSFALVFGAMGADISAVIMASLLLWLVNIFLPALCGIALYLYGYSSTSTSKRSLLGFRADPGN